MHGNWLNGGWGDDQRGGYSGRSSGRLVTKDANDLADFHLRTSRNRNLKNARMFGSDLRRDLVRFESKEDLPSRDGVAVIFMPNGEQATSDGFAHRRNFDISHEKREQR